MIKRVRVSLGFTKLPDSDLATFALSVIAALTKNGIFKNLPVTIDALQALLDTYDTALAAAKDRARTAVAEKDKARNALLDALRNDALYCSTVADGDEATLLKSGFLSASTNRAQTPLKQLQVQKVSNATPGTLEVRVVPERNARSFQGRIREAKGGEFGPIIGFASSRKILFEGLKAGIEYVLQICAVGGSTGQSEWSDPVTKMAQ